VKLGIFSKTFSRGSAADLFSTVAAAGYASVQFNLACVGAPMLPVAPVPAKLLREVEGAAHAHGVSLGAISGTFNLIHPDRAVVAAGMHGLGYLAEVCGQLGIPVITLCSGTLDPENMWREHPDNGSAAAWTALGAAIKEALAVTAKSGVRLAIEPEPANVINAAPRARRLLDEIKDPRLGFTMDGANLATADTAAENREILARAFELLGERIVLAHAKDRRVDGSICPAGQGIVDFPFFVERLKAAGYSGSLIVHGIDERDARATAEYFGKIIR